MSKLAILTLVLAVTIPSAHLLGAAGAVQPQTPQAGTNKITARSELVLVPPWSPTSPAATFRT